MAACQHLRILVVDDHEMVRSLLRHLLEAEDGWEVCGEAADGEQAVERSRTLHPDIVVMDAVMPRRNGFEATREIVRTTPEIPVVITTLYEYPEMLRQAAECRRAGVRRQIENHPAFNSRGKERYRASTVFPAAHLAAGHYLRGATRRALS